MWSSLVVGNGIASFLLYSLSLAGCGPVTVWGWLISDQTGESTESWNWGYETIHILGSGLLQLPHEVWVRKPRFHLVASVRGCSVDQRVDQDAPRQKSMVVWESIELEEEPIITTVILFWSDNWQTPVKICPTTPQGGFDATARDKKVVEVEVLLLKQLCELALRCDGYHWPASLISSRGQNHYSNRLNWFRRKQNQRLLVLAPLAAQTRCGKTEMEKKNVPSVDLKQEQHENNRFERLSVISL